MYDFNKAYETHSIAKFVDKKKEDKFMANLVGFTPSGRPLKRCPFKALEATVNLSKNTGSAGPRALKWAKEIKKDKLVKEDIERMYEEIRHENSNVTVDQLKDIFAEQDGKCYWTGLPLIPETIFTTFYSLSMSPDRLDNSGKVWGDYTSLNIVITTSNANRGRCSVNPNDYADQCRQQNSALGSNFEPMWFSDPRRDHYLMRVKEDPSLLKTSRKKKTV